MLLMEKVFHKEWSYVMFLVVTCYYRNEEDFYKLVATCSTLNEEDF